MNLHTLTSKLRRPSKRVGRGNSSGKGTTAGRGQKGQLSRGRGKVPGQFEGGQTSFIQKLPKNKGFNRVMKVYSAPVSLDDLNAFEDGSEVTLTALKEKRIIPGKSRAAKVLSTGTLSRKLTVSIPASATARSAIEKAGGTFTVVAEPAGEELPGKKSKKAKADDKQEE